MIAKAVEAPNLGYGRWILVDDETGEILDDAQGYGYRSAAGAHRAYAYKSMPKAKKRKTDAIKRKAKAFWEAHDSLALDIADMQFDALKNGEALSEKDIVYLIEVSGIDTGDLTPKQLVKYL